MYWGSTLYYITTYQSDQAKMVSNVQVLWLDSGPSNGKIDTISRRFVLEKGDLHEGQIVRVRLSTKKCSKAKVWKAKIIKLSEDDRPREALRRKKKVTTTNNLPAHIRKSLQKLSEDEFCFTTASAPLPITHQEMEDEDKRRKRKREDDYEDNLRQEKRRKEDQEDKMRQERRKKEDEEDKARRERRRREEEEYQERRQRQLEEEEQWRTQKKELSNHSNDPNISFELFSPASTPIKSPIEFRIGYSPKPPAPVEVSYYYL